MTALRLEWPKESKPFERLCCALWQSMDSSFDWDLNGRDGQAQHGIDILGRRGDEKPIGIECKARDRFLGSAVDTKLIDEIVDKVLGGEHANNLQRLIIASTSAQDSTISTHVAERSKQTFQSHEFEIEYWSWDRIEQQLGLSKHEDVRVNYMGFDGITSSSETRRRITDYCSTVRQSLNKLISLGHLRNDARPSDQDPDLSSVYTMLQVQQQVIAMGPLSRGESDSDEEGSARPGAGSGWTLPCDHRAIHELVERLCAEAESQDIAAADYSRAATVLEAATVAPRLLLTGKGGSGKTTFLRYLCLCLAGENLRIHGYPDSSPDLQSLHVHGRETWTSGRLVPIWVELGRFADSAQFPQTAEAATANNLWRYLEERPEDELSADLVGDLRRIMHGRHVIPSVLLTLDGIDELPNRGKQLDPLLAVLADLLKHYPRCRVVLTARPYAVDETDTNQWMQRQRFHHADLAAINSKDSSTFLPSFLRAWFRATKRPPAAADEFVTELQNRPQLRSIIDTPLMATMVAELFDSKQMDWNSRTDVFEAAVDRLVDRWNHGREVPGAELLSVDQDKVRLALEDLAWQIQIENSAAPKAERKFRFERHQLVEALSRQGIKTRDVDGIPKYLEDRCGILECVGDNFQFSRNMLREFLVASHAARLPDHPLPLIEAASDCPAHWREVLLLAGARGGDRARHLPAWTLLDHAIQEHFDGSLPVDDPQFEWVAVCAQLMVENTLAQDPRPADANKLDRLRRGMQACLTRGALAPKLRATVGQQLNVLGDQRCGVGLDASGLPDIDWLEVDVTTDGQARKIEVARYPITNSQYSAFVEDGGYSNERWASCWTRAGRTWLEQGAGTVGPDNDQREVLLLANHPRVGVCLHEAVAFANWLGKRRRRTIQLLPEADWERVARGQRQRCYPWGNDFDATRCNCAEAKIDSSCAVGLFPTGATPDGVCDLTGNTWEWAPTEQDPECEWAGAWRGGAWLSGSLFLRAGYRVVGFADYCFDVVGFRVCAPANGD